jgi:hypothetical protein
MSQFKLKDFPMLEYDYPTDQIERSGGISQDTRYDYVASSFLNGLINYGKNHKWFLLARYGLEKPEAERVDDDDDNDANWIAPTEANYQAFADRVTADRMQCFKPIGDDWLVLYETEASYFFMWYDQDSSDCSVERFCRRSLADPVYGITTFEQFVEARISWFKEAHFGESERCGYYPQGQTPQERVDILVSPAQQPRGWFSS